ncbi:DEKNAAC101744 [Brettanomyces naardenensis]|uniref:Exocyst complex component SEC5 n=1 Tax=Brettanomyces naardenensis TaxID=13370 RepID=A0A448YIP0_BRENA|nr:DEKNAAC101744 [Brettanomyces naardenensis]
MNGNSIVEESVLLNFYRLKTLNPTDYKRDTIQPKISIDLSTTDLNSIPKEDIYRFLSDGNEVEDDTRRSVGDSKAKNFNDPLGFKESVLDGLIDRDIVDDSRDPKSLKYMISSKSFNSALFLSTLHGDKSGKELKGSIEHLEKDLESKKPLLQQLIAANFTKTLYTKNSLDKVFGEFSESGLPNEIGSLKKSLAESSSSSNQLLNPIVLQISKEREVKKALDAIKENKLLLDLPSRLQTFIKEKDFYSVVTEYKRGMKFYQKSQQSNPILDKVWSKVRSVINDYKQGLWERLGKIHIEEISLNFGSSPPNEDNFITLITRILELGTDENPIIEFINLQFDYISKNIDDGLSKVQYTRLLKSRESIFNAYDEAEKEEKVPNKEDLSNVALRYIYTILTDGSELPEDGDVESYDLPMVMELWSFLTSYINEITDDVVTRKIVKFATVVHFFVYEFPKRFDSQLQDSFVEFEDYEKRKMREFFETLIEKVCTRLLFIFEATGKDLVSAIDSGTEVEPLTDSKNVNAQSSFGFIPPHSNVISAFYFSLQLQNKISDTFQDLLGHTGMLQSKSIDSAMAKTLKAINVNIVTGVLCTMNSDIRKLSYIEDWRLSDTFEGCTKLPDFLLNYYKLFITKLKELYIMEDPALFKRIQAQFLRSFDLLVENQLKAVITKSHEDSNSKDFYFITALSNLSALKLKVLPRIIQMFDNQFATSLSTSGLKVYSSLENFEVIIYDEYLKSYKSSLKDIIGTGVRSTNWYQMEVNRTHQSVVYVSNFVLKSINFINTIKSRLLNLKSNKNYILRVELDLDNYLISKLIDFLKEIRQFNSDGLLQICVDLRFLCEIFESMKQSNLKNEIHLSKLESVASRFLQKKGNDKDLISTSVKENLLQNKAQMDCFFGS